MFLKARLYSIAWESLAAAWHSLPRSGEVTSITVSLCCSFSVPKNIDRVYKYIHMFVTRA